MKPAVAPEALRVQALLGDDFEVVEFGESTRTSADAAASIGCAVAQIAKSLVFRSETGRSVLIIASGSNRVDEHKVEVLIGEAIGRADAAFVARTTGYGIGGVSPVGEADHLAILLDEDLRAFDTIWAAAGTPHAVFSLTPDDLARLTGAAFVDVAVDRGRKS